MSKTEEEGRNYWKMKFREMAEKSTRSIPGVQGHLVRMEKGRELIEKIGVEKKTPAKVPEKLRTEIPTEINTEVEKRKPAEVQLKGNRERNEETGENNSEPENEIKRKDTGSAKETELGQETSANKHLPKNRETVISREGENKRKREKREIDRGEWEGESKKTRRDNKTREIREGGSNSDFLVRATTKAGKVSPGIDKILRVFEFQKGRLKDENGIEENKESESRNRVGIMRNVFEILMDKSREKPESKKGRDRDSDKVKSNPSDLQKNHSKVKEKVKSKERVKINSEKRKEYSSQKLETGEEKNCETVRETVRERLKEKESKIEIEKNSEKEIRMTRTRVSTTESSGKFQSLTKFFNTTPVKNPKRQCREEGKQIKNAPVIKSKKKK